jgi:hypothetical protein
MPRRKFRLSISSTRNVPPGSAHCETKVTLYIKLILGAVYEEMPAPCYRDLRGRPRCHFTALPSCPETASGTARHPSK